MWSSILARIPTEVEKKRLYLDDLYNLAGPFDVMFTYKDQMGETCWSRWRDYLDARDDNHLIGKVNNRTICQAEIVLDLENPDLFEQVISKLERYRFSYKAYSTGSKGYHIHMLFPELLRFDERYRAQIKRSIIQFFRIPFFDYAIDLQKAGRRSPIALENVPHWKTGRPKQLVCAHIGINSLPHELLEEIQEYSRLHDHITTLQLMSSKSAELVQN